MPGCPVMPCLPLYLPGILAFRDVAKAGLWGYNLAERSEPVCLFKICVIVNNLFT